MYVHTRERDSERRALSLVEECYEQRVYVPRGLNASVTRARVRYDRVTRASAEYYFRASELLFLPDPRSLCGEAFFFFSSPIATFENSVRRARAVYEGIEVYARRGTLHIGALVM